MCDDKFVYTWWCHTQWLFPAPFCMCMHVSVFIFGVYTHVWSFCVHVMTSYTTAISSACRHVYVCRCVYMYTWWFYDPRVMTYIHAPCGCMCIYVYTRLLIATLHTQPQNFPKTVHTYDRKISQNVAYTATRFPKRRAHTIARYHEILHTQCRLSDNHVYMCIHICIHTFVSYG